MDREVADCVIQHLTLKIDPGRKSTGVALVRETPGSDDPVQIMEVPVSDGPDQTVVCLIEIVHRGGQIKKKMDQRRAYRKRRRSQNLRYRAKRYNNRASSRRKGRLAPSLNHRVVTVVNLVKKLIKFVPIKYIAVEMVRFDTQKLQNPNIQGAQYQQGTLLGYEIREYLLEKFGRKCFYCGALDTPLQIDHIVPSLLAELTKRRAVFLSRPRRFGKSLIISTLKEIFNGNKDLFTGLKISNPKLKFDFKKHPVINLNMAIESGSEKELKEELLGMLEDIARPWGLKLIGNSPSRALNNLITDIYNNSDINPNKEKVVVLIDDMTIQ